MRGQVYLLISLASLAALSSARISYSQGPFSGGRECPADFAKLAASVAKPSGLNWNSLEVQGRRLKAVLKGDLSDDSPRVRNILDHMHQVFRFPSRKWDERDIRIALKELGTDNPQMNIVGNQVIYVNRATGRLIVEDPLCGCYWFDRFENVEKPDFGDWNAVAENGGKIFNNRPFSSHRIGDTEADALIMRGLSRAYARVFGATGSIGRRIAETGDNWQQSSLGSAIERFLGSEYRAVPDSYKTMLVNNQNAIGIVDDPTGHYFRLFKWDGDNRMYLNWNGFPADSTQEGLALTHFRYQAHPDEYGLDLQEVQERLKKHVPKISDEAPKQPKVFVPREWVARAGDGEVRAPLPGPVPTGSIGILHIINETNTAQRVEALNALPWTKLTERDKEQLIQSVRIGLTQRIERGINSDADIRAIAALAQRSEDARWIPVLERWEAYLSRTFKGWQSYSRVPVGNALKAMRERQRELQSPMGRLLRETNPIARQQALGQLIWTDVSSGERAQVIAKANELVVSGPPDTLSNSYEIAAYIELASRSLDPQWIPLLTRWESAWKNATGGWQYYRRREVERVLHSLRDAERQRPVPLASSSSGASHAVRTTPANVPAPVVPTQLKPGALYAALNGLDWKKITSEERQQLIALARKLVVIGPLDQQSSTADVMACIEIARGSKDADWIPVLGRWEMEWRKSRRGWQNRAYDEAVVALDELRSQVRKGGTRK